MLWPRSLKGKKEKWNTYYYSCFYWLVLIHRMQVKHQVREQLKRCKALLVAGYSQLMPLKTIPMIASNQQWFYRGMFNRIRFTVFFLAPPFQQSQSLFIRRMTVMLMDTMLSLEYMFIGIPNNKLLKHRFPQKKRPPLNWLITVIQ